MTWFDVIKDVKDEAEEFFNNFFNTLVDYFDAMEKRLLEDLDTLDDGSLATTLGDLNELELEIMKPMLDLVNAEKKKALDNVHSALDVIRETKKEVLRIQKETKDAPPEIKISRLSERFQNLGENPEGYPQAPKLDQKKIDDILHRLGFEGKGME